MRNNIHWEQICAGWNDSLLRHTLWRELEFLQTFSV